MISAVADEGYPASNAPLSVWKCLEVSEALHFADEWHIASNAPASVWKFQRPFTVADKWRLAPNAPVSVLPL